MVSWSPGPCERPWRSQAILSRPKTNPFFLGPPRSSSGQVPQHVRIRGILACQRELDAGGLSLTSSICMTSTSAPFYIRSTWEFTPTSSPGIQSQPELSSLRVVGKIKSSLARHRVLEIQTATPSGVPVLYGNSGCPTAPFSMSFIQPQRFQQYRSHLRLLGQRFGHPYCYLTTATGKRFRKSSEQVPHRRSNVVGY